MNKNNLTASSGAWQSDAVANQKIVVKDKIDMTDYQFQNASSYLMNLVGCLFLPVVLMPILFASNVLFPVSLMFCVIMLNWNVMCFVRSRVYASVYDSYKFSKRFFKLESISFLLIVVCAIAILFTDYVASLQGLEVVSSIWIPLKVILNLYAFVVGFVFIGVSYEKNRFALNLEAKMRREYKKQNQISAVGNTRGYRGGYFKNLKSLSNTNLHFSILNWIFLWGCAISMVLFVTFVFLVHGTWGDKPITFALFGLISVFSPVSWFVKSRINILRLNASQRYYSEKRFWLENFLYLLCVSLSIVVMFLGISGKDSEPYKLFYTDWFLALRIALSVLIVALAAVLVNSAILCKKLCNLELENYCEIDLIENVV